MKRLIAASLFLVAMSWNIASAAILVYSPNGQFVPKTSVVSALTDADTANKHIVITTPNASLAAFVNMSSGRTIEFKDGGCIALSGSGGIGKLTYAEPEYFCAKGGGAHDDGPAARAAVTAVKATGGEIHFPKEKYLIGGATAGADGIKNGILVPWSGDFYGGRKAVKFTGRSQGTTLLAGDSSMAVIRAANPYVTLEHISIEGGVGTDAGQSKYAVWPNHTNVYGVLVAPEDITGTTVKSSSDFFSIKHGTVAWCTEGIFFKCGPNASSSSHHTIEQSKITDNTRNIAFDYPTDVGTLKNLVTEVRIVNSNITNGNVGVDCTGVAGLTLLHTKIENVNQYTSPLAIPTGLYIPDNFATGFSYGHNVMLIDTGIEACTRSMNNADRTTSFVNSNYNTAALGERLVTSWNKNGGEALRDGAEISSDSRQVQARAMDPINGTVAFEVSNKIGGTDGAFFTSYPFFFGGATTNSTVFRKATSLMKLDYDSYGGFTLMGDPNNLHTGNAVGHIGIGGADSVKIYGNQAGGYGNAAATIAAFSKDAGTNRSINAAGTINASGADYAEYLKRSPKCGTISKGDIVGIDSAGLVTDKYSEAISFMVRSTDPGTLGNDIFAEGEAEQIAFAGQVPVHVPGAHSGDYIIPVKHRDKIRGKAVKHPTFRQYMTSVGRVIKVEGGIATIIVKAP